MSTKPDTPKKPDDKAGKSDAPSPAAEKPKEIGGRGGLDPVRYGDWEIGGKCVDFKDAKVIDGQNRHCIFF